MHVEARPDAPSAGAWSLPSNNGSETLYLDTEVVIDQSQVATADVEEGPDGNAQIRLALTSDGTAKLLEVTSRHVGGRLGIVVDGKLRAAPHILAPVANGVLIVSGSFTASDAAAWARRLGPAAPAKVARPAGDWLSPAEVVAVLQPLQGTWSGLSATMDGRLRAEPKVSRSTWTFRGGDLTLTTGDGQSARFSLRVESGSSNSFWLEPLPPSKESGWVLFARDGDRLTLAFGDNLGQRPDSFAPGPKKVLLKLARQGSVPNVIPCDILEAAGVAGLLPSGARDAERERRAEGPACIRADARGQGITLMVVPAVGRTVFDRELEETRKRLVFQEDRELGATAFSMFQGGIARFVALKGETFVLLSFELADADAERLREFARRVLATVPDVP